MLSVLVLCTGNSARSILGEALLSREGRGRVRAFSAGSHPKGAPHPEALALLARRGIDTSFARSKSWDEFAAPGAPALDLVITVCDSAAGETCPFWPGAPVTVHWGIPDPHTAADFERAEAQLLARIRPMMALPFERLPRDELRVALQAIGEAA